MAIAITPTNWGRKGPPSSWSIEHAEWKEERERRSPSMAIRHEVEIPSWRLPSHHIVTLQDIARGSEESESGITTKYLLDELEQHGPHPDDIDPVRLFDLEGFCDRFGALNREFVNEWRLKMRRARKALNTLSLKGDHHIVAILHCVYGYPDPVTKSWPKTSIEFLGIELAQLVRYTEATEEVRRRLIRAETVRPQDPTMMAFACRNLEYGSWTRDDEPTRVGSGLREMNEVVDLASVREREIWFDRVITSGDALRVAFEQFPEVCPKKGPDEDKSAYADRCRPYEERKNAHTMKRASFLMQAKAEADRLLTNASRRFHQVWLTTP